MFKNAAFATIFTTIYLAVYCAFTQFAPMFSIAFAMFLAGPVLMLWLGFTVLKHGKYNGAELGEREFGYQDKQKGKLGVL
jgi:hypothetical protein